MNYQEPLTMREREVLALVAQGLSNRGTAEVLGISEATVQNHLRVAFDKLGVTSRIQAGLKANLLVYTGQVQINSDAQMGQLDDEPSERCFVDPGSVHGSLRTGDRKKTNGCSQND